MIEVSKYFLRYKKIIFFIFLQIVIIQVFQLLKPWPIKYIFDYIVEEKNLPLFHIDHLPIDFQLFALCIAFVLIYFLLGAFVLANNITKMSFGNKILNDIRIDVFRKLQKVQMSYFNKKSVGDLIYRAINDTQAIQIVATKIMFPLFSSTILLIGIFIVIFQINKKLLFVFLLTIPFLFISISFLNKSIYKISNNLREKESRLLSAIENYLNNIFVIRLFNMEDIEHKKLEVTGREALKSNLQLNLFETIHAWVVNVLIALGTSLILWIGVRQVLNSELTIGDLIIFISYLESLYGPINNISQSISLYYESQSGIKRILSLLNEKEIIVDGRKVIKDNSIENIEFKNVYFSFDSKKYIINNANFKILRHEKVALLGKSGSGKTTIASLIVRIIEPSIGEILINNLNIKDIKIKSLRENICLVTQRPIIFNGTIFENINYSNKSGTRYDLDEILEIVCLDSFVRNLPDHLDTQVGEKGAKLSEGEKQRISLARALLTDADVFIFDEATSAIDKDTQDKIFERIMKKFEDKTILYATHRLENLKYCDYVLLIKEGKILKADKSSLKI
ncbi:Xenobiotic-transporting ATPase [Thermodesulfobium narugense DSM 14796]|uniref:Xenobiotic-transporting ATPase n=1 Tax=Thermodesulfobium narugense DSM 14796 TaxID=747365 RepID=M1E8Y6_9BACT|nr:ABC transporter ATP-binding protein [Thermodesulfobium narugense]AEE14734.1 Xenobiotic-transporting ATPase [Thermodesulfobium narugense DSM 14796]